MFWIPLLCLASYILGVARGRYLGRHRGRREVWRELINDRRAIARLDGWAKLREELKRRWPEMFGRLQGG